MTPKDRECVREGRADTKRGRRRERSTGTLDAAGKHKTIYKDESVCERRETHRRKTKETNDSTAGLVCRQTVKQEREHTHTQNEVGPLLPAFDEAKQMGFYIRESEIMRTSMLRAGWVARKKEGAVLLATDSRGNVDEGQRCPKCRTFTES